MTKIPRLILFSIISLLFIIIFLPSVLHSAGFTIFSDQFCNGICHQNPAKSFYINEVKLPVCARCLGIYSGAFIASIISFFLKDIFPAKLTFLLYFCIPMLADVIFTSLNGYNYNLFLAFLTGILFGYPAFYYILNGFEKLFEEVKKERI